MYFGGFLPRHTAIGFTAVSLHICLFLEWVARTHRGHFPLSLTVSVSSSLMVTPPPAPPSVLPQVQVYNAKGSVPSHPSKGLCRRVLCLSFKSFNEVTLSPVPLDFCKGFQGSRLWVGRSPPGLIFLLSKSHSTPWEVAVLGGSLQQSQPDQFWFLFMGPMGTPVSAWLLWGWDGCLEALNHLKKTAARSSCAELLQRHHLE